MKIFVSYSRRDAGDFADQIQKYLSTFNYDVFTDISSINVGDVWSSAIGVNISTSDIFVILITYGSLQSPHVEKEVLQAQNEKKKIIPCIQREINYADVKWGLDDIQGIEFDDKYDLARKLYLKIVRINQQSKDVITGNEDLTSSSVPSDSKEDSLKEKEILSQQANRLENEPLQYFSSSVHSSPTSYTEPENSRTYSNSSGVADESNPDYSSNNSNFGSQNSNYYVKRESSQNNSLKLLAPIGAGIAIVVILIVVFTSGIMGPPIQDDKGEQQLPPGNINSSISNTPPIANNQSVTTAMNKPLAIALTANDVDVNDNLTGAIVTPSSHGTLSPINQDTGIVTYIPNRGFTGDDSFTFIANDGKQNSTKAGIVEIRVSNN